MRHSSLTLVITYAPHPKDSAELGHQWDEELIVREQLLIGVFLETRSLAQADLEVHMYEYGLDPPASTY